MQFNIDLNPANLFANRKTIIAVITGALIQGCRFLNIPIPEAYLNIASTVVLFLAILFVKLGQIRYQKEIQAFNVSINDTLNQINGFLALLAPGLPTDETGEIPATNIGSEVGSATKDINVEDLLKEGLVYLQSLMEQLALSKADTAPAALPATPAKASK